MQANSQHTVNSHVVNVRQGDPLPEGTATVPPHQYMMSSWDNVPPHHQPEATFQKDAVMMSSLGDHVKRLDRYH